MVEKPTLLLQIIKVTYEQPYFQKISIEMFFLNIRFRKLII